MNFPTVDSLIGRQRCRQWVPLITQQLRLRHLYQVTAFNIISEKQGSFYFTLHLTTFSAPFYTSEKVNMPNPKWSEIEFPDNTPLSVSGIVIRIWQHEEGQNQDVIITTWGINFSGLVYIGQKASEIQPPYFKDNSVILHLRGGFFTSHRVLRTDLPKPLPFIDYLNLLSTEEETKISKTTVCCSQKPETRISYNSEKLQKLHSLQILIRNKTLDAKNLRENIEAKCGLNDKNEEIPVLSTDPSTSENPPIRYAPQLLTMNSLNKMLQDKPTKGQRKEITKIKKEIEIAKFRSKLLIKERAYKQQCLRVLKDNYNKYCDRNELKESIIMDNYRLLNKDVEKLKEWRKEQIHLREVLMHYTSQLHHRRRQLIQQLLCIYPIKQIEPNKFCINGVYLPDADLLTDSTDTGLSVALGYVAHTLIMCSIFLQVPLRYPIVHLGSRSYIIDHISPALTNDREKEFPLYSKGKDRMNFNYAVYLLNKNIAQLRLLCGQQTPDLRMILPNLLSFLQGKDNRDIGLTLHCKLEQLSLKMKHEKGTRSKGDEISINSKVGENGDCDSKNKDKLFFNGDQNTTASANIADPVLEVKQYCQLGNSFSPKHKTNKKSKKTEAEGPGLSEILAIPEAYLNRQISSSAFKNYISVKRTSDNIEDLDTTTKSQEGLSKSGCSKSEKAVRTGNKPNVSNTTCDIKVAMPSNQTMPDSPNLLENVEQGTDILDDTTYMKKSDKIEVYSEQPVSLTVSISQSIDINNKQKRKSRSVGSYTEEDRQQELKINTDLGSDPAINVLNVGNDSKSLDLNALPGSLETRQSEFLQKWLDSGPALVCSEENLYPEEILGTVAENGESALTARTDALLSTTSFNLVRPKY